MRAFGKYYVKVSEFQGFFDWKVVKFVDFFTLVFAQCIVLCYFFIIYGLKSSKVVIKKGKESNKKKVKKVLWF